MIKAAVVGTLAASSLLLAWPALAQGRTSTPSAAAASKPVTLAERQAAWSANKAEYRRRLVSDGQRSADRWLEEQARAKRGGAGAGTTQGSAAPRTTSPARPAARGTKDCKKVRWVNRATPGFGGGPMTMSRVAVCDD